MNHLLASLSSQFTLVDWGVVVGYLALTTWLGARMAGKQASMRDFFLGGRKLPWYAVSGSIIATEISALTFVSVPAIVFGIGGNFTYLQLGVIGTFLARIVVGYVFVPAYYKNEIYSPYDYMGNKLGKRVLSMTSVLFSLGGILGQSARVYLTAQVLLVVLSDQLDWLANQSAIPALAWAIIFIGVVSVGWTLIGGITTVIWTDVILFLVFLLGAAVAFGYVVFQLDGGLAEVFRTGWNAKESGAWGKFTFFDFSISPSQEYTFWAAAIASTWGSLGAYGTDQLLAQRMFCCKDERDARWAIISSTSSQVVTLTVMLVGVGLFAYYRQAPESETTSQPVAMLASYETETTTPKLDTADTAVQEALRILNSKEEKDWTARDIYKDLDGQFASLVGKKDLGLDKKLQDKFDLAVKMQKDHEDFPGLTGESLKNFSEKSDRIFPIFIVTQLPVGIKGLIIAGIFAAAISSLMGILTALSQVVMTAFYNPYREWQLRKQGITVKLSGNVEELTESATSAEDKRSVFVGRLMVIFWGGVLCVMAFVASYIADYYKSILDLGLAMVGFTSGALLAGFALAFLPVKVDDRGFMWSAPLSCFFVFGMVWHQEWTHGVCWAVAIVMLLLWCWYRMKDVREICTLDDTDELKKAAYKFILRDWPQTIILIVGLAAMIWVNHKGLLWTTDPETGLTSPMKIAWPWYCPIGSTVAFIWGVLLANKRDVSEDA